MQSNAKKTSTHHLGGIPFHIPDDETEFHPKTNPGRTREQQAELENGLRAEEDFQRRWEHEAELQLRRDSKNY